MKRFLYTVLRNNFNTFILFHKAKKAIKNKDFEKISSIAEKVIKTSNISLEIKNEEILKNSKKAVLFVNHRSFFDPFFLISKNSNIAFVQKEELKKVKILRDYVELTKGEFIDRKNPKTAMKSIINLNKLLKEKESQLVCIFPEGTRNYSNELLEFKAGSFKLGTKEKVDIIPVAIIGAKALDKSHEKRKVIVQYLTPIKYEEYKDLKTNELAELVRQQIQKVLEREEV